MRQVRIEISSALFGGYLIWATPEQFDSLESLTMYCHHHLLYTLTVHNLDYLIDQAKGLNFHIHDFTLEQFRSREKDIYYICDHCGKA